MRVDIDLFDTVLYLLIIHVWHPYNDIQMGVELSPLSNFDKIEKFKMAAIATWNQLELINYYLLVLHCLKIQYYCQICEILSFWLVHVFAVNYDYQHIGVDLVLFDAVFSDPSIMISRWVWSCHPLAILIKSKIPKWPTSQICTFIKNDISIIYVWMNYKFMNDKLTEHIFVFVWLGIITIIIYLYKIAILDHGMQSFHIIVYCTPVYCTLVYCMVVTSRIYPA